MRRARVLKERTDMPLERVEAYEKWGEDMRDAARYRWLRDRLLGADFDWQGTQALVFEMPQGARVSASCDATVDAAMAMPANDQIQGRP